MKNLILIIAIVGLSVATYAQTTKQDSKKSTSKTEHVQQKDHVCTAACQNGSHVYAHGEKGHVCTAACQTTTDKKDAGLKDHVCTAACKDGKHVYAHGEKGHVCGPECAKKMN
jgi:hypothetical protein